MRYSEIREAAVALFKGSKATPVYISGAPGLGKTSLMYDVASDLGINREAVFLFRPSLHDPVDLMGVPHVEDGSTHWAAPVFLKQVNAAAEKYGTAMLCWDELPQAVVMMQNAIAGGMLDRQIGEFKFHPGVIQMATGNRTIDKAGANRVVTQLANRVMHLQMDVHTEDWVVWALTSGIDPVDVAFIQFRDSLLLDFDPNRFENPTPRSWEKVFRDIPKTVHDGIFHSMASGLVGEGAASEYLGFKRIADKTVKIADILKAPLKAHVPDDPSALYAVCGSIASKADAKNIDVLYQYVSRMPEEFQVLCIRTALTLKKDELSQSEAFKKFISRNVNLII